MKKKSPQGLTIMALAIAMNLVMSNVALLLRLPIYLDTIGTILSATLLGALAGIVVGLTTGVISGVTTDLFALYYAPGQLLVGLMAGWLVHNQPTLWSIAYKALLITLPCTIYAAIVTATLFGGITSSGSSIIVQFLAGLGLDKTVSVFIVQVGTDYLDKFLSISVVLSAIRLLPRYRKIVS